MMLSDPMIDLIGDVTIVVTVLWLIWVLVKEKLT